MPSQHTRSRSGSRIRGRADGLAAQNVYGYANEPPVWVFSTGAGFSTGASLGGFGVLDVLVGAGLWVGVVCLGSTGGSFAATLTGSLAAAGVGCAGVGVTGGGVAAVGVGSAVPGLGAATA